MSHLYRQLGPRSDYVDRLSGCTPREWHEKLRSSTTLYVGNLSFYTTEDQIYALFSKCGDLDVVVMGLNKFKKNPCGFCFVKYFTHAAANRAVELLNGAIFDERQIRVDWDSGEGISNSERKFGRGAQGMQWRDAFRKSFDAGRGGEGGGAEYVPLGQRRKKRNHYDKHWEKYGNSSDKKRHATMLKLDNPIKPSDPVYSTPQ